MAIRQKQDGMNSFLSDQNLNLPAMCKQIFHYSEIISAIDNLANNLNTQLENSEPVVLCVMQGGLVFSGHLIPRLNCLLEVDYIHATRYNNQTIGDVLSWKSYPHTTLNNRTVLILDDILDEGLTLNAIVDYCVGQGASEVLSAVLIRKLHDRCIENKPTDQALRKNIALTVDDQYVFGFGMDLNGKYRQLPHIYALSETS